ncbi:MAG: hypothetical protein LBG15_04315 [Dysgonamonadaceae bacterium]|jgi:hypothetical protein|nr:hypothetical protein [Dysgonamonadaceae bacterium]
MEKFIEKFPGIDRCRLLFNERFNSTEGGACDESCKKGCSSGNQNGAPRKKEFKSDVI